MQRVILLPPPHPLVCAQVGIKQGFLGGLVVGITNGVAFFAYALALWYGSTRVDAGDYTGAPLPPLHPPHRHTLAEGQSELCWAARYALQGCKRGLGVSWGPGRRGPQPAPLLAAMPVPDRPPLPDVVAPLSPGGDVVNVLFSALIGGFALGQAAPNVQYFQQGKVAGARIFEIMGRHPGIDFDADGGEDKNTSAPAACPGAFVATCFLTPRVETAGRHEVGSCLPACQRHEHPPAYFSFWPIAQARC